MKEQEILKNQLIQKAQQYFINIASIFEFNWDSKDLLLRLLLLRKGELEGGKKKISAKQNKMMHSLTIIILQVWFFG